MTLNPTLNYLFEKFSVSLLPFSRALTTSSMYLAGAGWRAGDGFPLPAGGEVLGMRAWDGTHDKYKMQTVTVDAGNRISVYAEHVDSSYTVTVRVNGEDTDISVTGINESTDIYACVYLNLQRS
jgi:hypothetical protein